MSGLIRKKEPGQGWETVEDTNGGSLPSGAVTLTPTQIVNLDTTPVQIVAAQGAGKVIIPLAVVFAYAAGATPYSDGGGSLRVITAVSAAATWLQLTGAGFWDQATDELAQTPLGGVGPQDPAPLENQGLYVDSFSGASGGNGTITVTCWYTVLTVT